MTKTTTKQQLIEITSIMIYRFGNIWLDNIEKDVLNQIIIWTNECLKSRESGNFKQRPDTKKCNEYFQYNHREMLKVLNQLQDKGLVIKRRKLASGPHCAAYNGANHSEVIPIDTAFNIFSLVAVNTH